MVGFFRLLTLERTILGITALSCQSVWAQTDEYASILARYDPITDQLCNYCQDYSVGSVPAGTLATLYQPGIGYPPSAGVEQVAGQDLALGSTTNTAVPPVATSN